MLNKKDIIRILTELNLPIKKYWILAGTALVMHGVKDETRDIDMGCTKDLFQSLIPSGYEVKEWKDGSRSLSINQDIEIFEEWNVDEVQYIYDLPVGSLESIKKHKMQLGREKDLKDIELIDKFLVAKK